MERWAKPRLSQHASYPDSDLLGVLRPLPTRGAPSQALTMPGPDPDDSQLRPEPRDAALFSVRSLKVHRASLRACVQQDCIPSMPREGGSGWRAPGGGGGKPGSGTFPGKRPPHQDLEQGQLATGILRVLWRLCGVHGGEGFTRGRDSEGWGLRGRGKEHGQFQRRTQTLPSPPSWSYVLVHSLVTPHPASHLPRPGHSNLVVLHSGLSELQDRLIQAWAPLRTSQIWAVKTGRCEYWALLRPSGS